MKERCAALVIKPTARVMTVSIAQQLLGFYRDEVLIQSYIISTSLRPPSNRKDSRGTPRGLHEIAERIGAGALPGTVFKGRVNLGQHFNELSGEEHTKNLITSRILWLRGREPGVNAGGEVDSYERYIYMHGTNHEEKLGTPFSGGCIEMRNLEIIALFAEIRVGDLIWIED
ncbi:MAG: L,D-transpeptidase [Opitutia bacterium Tous-C10FEB]|nr:MAG: L,D-transpeptidase [Opitutae bacterium Tous-C10FEB]